MGLLSKPIKTLDDLFVHTLQDIYYAENQIAKNLPKMIGKATDPELKQGFETHLRETQNQIKRLENEATRTPKIREALCAALAAAAEARVVDRS